MNYAKDRLDRRATARMDSTTDDQLECDLNRAHCVFRNHGLCRSHGCEAAAGDGDEATPSSALDNLRAAHELAGKTLRDCGKNHQAVFHFGMAWRINHWSEKLRRRNNSCATTRTFNDDDAHEENEWKSVGDYAQMCEFSGFPEIGVLSLLFYREGGCIDFDSITPICLPSIDATNDEPNANQCHGCGCNMVDCGKSPCFVAFPYKSTVMDNILLSLDEFSIHFEEKFPCALDILAQLAHMSRMTEIIGDPTEAMHNFLCKQKSIKNVPSILRFWENERFEQSKHRRVLPPLILLLLLKLLYSSPISRSFLQLACISIPYLAVRFPLASPEGKQLAQRFKSHWAYYVFIRALVLGDRVKKHRKGITGQTPVWDVVFCAEAKTLNETQIEEGERVHELDYFLRIFRVCSTESSMLSTNRKSSMPSLVEQMIRPYSTHFPIFVVGDSHVLSLAWQTMHIDTSKTRNNNEQQNGLRITRTAVPFPATGMKAWHFRPATRFFTHYNLLACLKRLPLSDMSRTIILSAGEIDCREGIGGSLLQGYYRNCSDAVTRTVADYLSSLSDIALEFQLQILVMPVSPHAYRSEKNGKSTGRARRRETTHLWNESLRHELTGGSRYDRVFLLDYEKRLHHPDSSSPVGYVLHPFFNADYTHVNSAIVPLIEDAISTCGCNLALL
jgi:hypothetical protein